MPWAGTAFFLPCLNTFAGSVSGLYSSTQGLLGNRVHASKCKVLLASKFQYHSLVGNASPRA